MAPRKLSDSDKDDIVDLYKQPGQTTSTLAEQFGVSNSTISRILKTTLPSDEYSELIAQKRMSSGTATKTQTSSKRSATSKRTTSKAGSKASSKAVIDTTNKSSESEESGTSPVDPPKLRKETAKESDDTGSSTRRRRSRKKDTDDGQLPLLDQHSNQDQDDTEADMSASAVEEATDKKVVPSPILLTKSSSDEEDDDEDDLEGLDETIGDDFGDDDDDLDEDEDDLDDEDDEFEVPQPKLQAKESVEIMSLGTAVMPKPCYLVVDMRAELITCPLSEFGHLGRIPSNEEKSTTLPVFDNHRVARRFSRNKQRVIKVPDGSLITRTRPYLQAKGITRLLVDGQVFDLVDAE